MAGRTSERGRGRGRRGVIGAAIAALGILAAGPTSAAYTDPLVIRTAPEDRSPMLGDIATTASRVAVAWTEDWAGPVGIEDPWVYVRASDDRGQTWAPTLLLEKAARQPSTAICGRYLFVAYAVDLRNELYPNRWSIILYERDLEAGTQHWEQISSGNERAQHPDVACGGDRVWVAWDDKIESRRHAYLTHSKVAGPGGLSFVTAIDLGRTRPTGGVLNGPSVAAVAGMGYVSWGAYDAGGGGVVRFKRYSVGPGPGYLVTPLASKTIKTLADPFSTQPEMEAAGDHVAIVYWLPEGEAGVRASHDRGASFGAQARLANPPYYGGFPFSIGVRGSRITVIVQEFVEGPAGTARFVSTNGGASFGRTMLSGDKGFRVAGFVAVSGSPRLVEAWDGYWYNVRRLRFHRQT